MRCWFIVMPKIAVNAMAIFPFILLKSTSQKQDLILINHEKIHLQQQLELLIIPFYFLYLLNYLINLFKYKKHYPAYFNIMFEKEAYQAEKHLNYLSKRKWCAWINFYSP